MGGFLHRLSHKRLLRRFGFRYRTCSRLRHRSQPVRGRRRRRHHLYALIGVGVCIVVYVLYRIIEQRKLKQLADKELLSIIVPDYSAFRKHLKFVLFTLAAVFFIIAWAQPQYGVKKQNVKKKGVEIAIALDVSNSMLAEDIKPNRIEKAKFSIQRIINKLEQLK